MKNYVILGSTGSIGTQTLSVIENLQLGRILALSAYSNVDLLEKQLKKFKPDYAVMVKKEAAIELKKRAADTDTEILSGKSALQFIAGLKETDMVVNALVGAVGLQPSLSCLEAGCDLALANKESMVIGGTLLKEKIRGTDQKILPVDSEHNAIFQIINNKKNREIKEVYLTASGGPFLNYSPKEMENVTVKQALKHPNWDMGAKISIDSATLMNKGLEVIEAHFFFDLPFDKIKVIIHPESIIHSMVEFIDNTIHAELGPADMRLPIQNVLTYPETLPAAGERLDLFQLEKLSFQPPDFKQFPALRLAYQAGQKGGSFPVVLNAANEETVRAFLAERLSFKQISVIIESVLNRHNKISNPSFDEIQDIDSWARAAAKEEIKEC